MTDIEKNALRIAELKGFTELTPWILKSANGVEHNKTDVLSCVKTYDGLMPIVFECNNLSPYGQGLNIAIYHNSIVFYDKSERKTTYDYNTELEFIHAIQLAVIKYLESKK